MGSQYIIASDLGTGGCKTVLVNHNGTVFASATSEYPMQLPKPGWFEQDPQQWLKALGKTVRSVLAKANIPVNDIVAFGLDGVTHNVVLLDEHGQPLRPCITFYDIRSMAEVEEIRKKWGSRVFERTWNSVSPVWTWPQLLWIRRHEPEVWAKTRSILCQKDYVRDQVARSPLTDLIDAEGTLLFDPISNQWIDEFLQDLELAACLLPTAVPPASIVGKIDRRGAELTGLPEGIPVIAGTTDTVAEVLGAGALQPGQGTVKLASVGRITCVSTAPTRHPQLLNYRHVIDDLWYPGTATKFAASAFRWLRDSLWPGGSYDEMTEAAESVPPGCNGLIFHPHLEGEWVPFWDDNLRGDFIGLTMRHGRAHFSRAVMEGVAFALRTGLEYASSLGLAFNDLRLIGQGVKSNLWKQIIADTLNRTISIPAEKDAAFGTALLTGMGVGFFPSASEEIKRFIHMEEEILPNPAEVDAYDRLFKIYKQSDAALHAVSHELTRFESRYAEKSSPASQGSADKVQPEEVSQAAAELV